MATHPTVGDMIKHPYGVVENYVDPDGQVYQGIYASIVHKTVPSFEYHYQNLLKGFLLQAAANEQAKEIQYINKMMSCFDDQLKNSVLYQDFSIIYDSVIAQGRGASLNLSILVDTIQKMKLGLYELDKGVKENFEIFKDINMAFLDRNVVEELRRVLKYEGAGSSKKIIGTLSPNTTGKQMLDDILSAVEDKMKKAIKESNINKQSKEGQKLIAQYEKSIENIIELYRIKLGQFYTKKFVALDTATNILEMKISELEAAAQQYDNLQTAKSKKILVNSDYEPRTLHQVIVNVITGEWGGKSPEFILDVRHGGMNTGNVTGSNHSIDADNIQLVNAEANFYFGDWNDRKQMKLKDGDTPWDDISTLDAFIEQAKRIEEFESLFMVMYSDKDQSVSKDFKNKIAHTDIKIKGDAKLVSRGPEIIEMYNMLDHPGAMDPTDLVFSIANLAQEFVCNGQADEAKRTLGAICVGWMFDDVEQIIKGSSLIGGVKTIHFYNINNYFYTLSDILYKTANALNSASASNYNAYVKIGISVPGDNIYSSVMAKTSLKEGMPRWEAVSNNLLNKTKVDIHMNPKSLFNALFGDIFGAV